MKKLLYLLVLSAALGTNAFAQSSNPTPMTMTPPYKVLTVGPMATFGGAVSAGSVDQGFKTTFKEAFSFGALGYYAVNEVTAFSLGLAYDARKINFHAQDNVDFYTNSQFNYFMIEPGLRLSAFTIGLGIGLPMAGSFTTQAAAGVPSTSGDIKTDHLNTLVEGRIGAAIPVAESDGGDLRFLINASYPFTQIYDNLGEKSNGPLASLQLGLSYQFNLMPNK